MTPGEISLLLLVIGGIFLFLELFLPSFGVIGFIGLLFTVLGLGTYSHHGVYQAVINNWDWLAILTFIGILIGLTIAYIAYRTNRIKPMTGREDLVAKEVEILEWSQTSGKVSVEGEIWSAFSDEVFEFNKGDRVYIAQVKNLTLRIIPK